MRLVKLRDQYVLYLQNQYIQRIPTFALISCYGQLITMAAKASERSLKVFTLSIHAKTAVLTFIYICEHKMAYSCVIICN